MACGSGFIQKKKIKHNKGIATPPPPPSTTISNKEQKEVIANMIQNKIPLTHKSVMHTQTDNGIIIIHELLFMNHNNWMFECIAHAFTIRNTLCYITYVVAAAAANNKLAQ